MRVTSPERPQGSSQGERAIDVVGLADAADDAPRDLRALGRVQASRPHDPRVHAAQLRQRERADPQLDVGLDQARRIGRLRQCADEHRNVRPRRLGEVSDQRREAGIAFDQHDVARDDGARKRVEVGRNHRKAMRTRLHEIRRERLDYCLA